MEAAGVSFPHDQSEAPDPQGRYAVLSNEIEAPGPYGPNGLFLKDLRTGKTEFLLGFERSADVLWSPDGCYLAVTNWFGSNVCEIFVFKPGTKDKVYLRDALEKAIGVFPWTSSIENLSECFEALSWETPSRLKFVVGGHGLRKGKGVENFEEFYVYDTSGTIHQAPNK